MKYIIVNVTCKVNIENKRGRLHREAEDILTYSREEGKIGCGELAMALRQHHSFCSRPLSDKTKYIPADIIQKTSD